MRSKPGDTRVFPTVAHMQTRSFLTGVPTRHVLHVQCRRTLHTVFRMDVEIECSPLLDEKRTRFLYAQLALAIDVPGDVAECGVYRGDTAAGMIRFLQTRRLAKVVHLFDCFEGLPPVRIALERDDANLELLRPGTFRASRQEVEERLTGLTQHVLHAGLFADVFPTFTSPLCFIHADADLYVSTAEVIDLADRCVMPGGRIVFDDYDDPAFPGVTMAVRTLLDRSRYRISVSGSTSQCVAVKKGPDHR